MQTRRGSLIEACANTAIGYLINLGVQLLVYPMFGATFTFTQNILIGLIFMAVSIVRGFAVRRWFNGCIVRAAQAIAHEKDVDKDRNG